MLPTQGVRTEAWLLDSPTHPRSIHDPSVAGGPSVGRAAYARAAQTASSGRANARDALVLRLHVAVRLGASRGFHRPCCAFWRCRSGLPPRRRFDQGPRPGRRTLRLRRIGWPMLRPGRRRRWAVGRCRRALGVDEAPGGLEGDTGYVAVLPHLLEG